MLKLIKKKKKEISIKNFYERKNKVLIKRKCGGFGDVLMQRMIFEDLKKLDIEITYSCPYQFIEMANNHPYLDNVLDLSRVNEDEYGIIYDISTICAITESKELEKNKNHRSDIWANFIGLKLENHEMHLAVDVESKNFCLDIIKKINTEKKPTILLCTKSSNNPLGKAKGLTSEQTKKIVNYVKEIGLFPITTDELIQEIYTELEVKQFTPIDVKTWISLVSVCDYILSVDTATFHIAGGLKKPLIGIFSFTDGKIYGKYFDFILIQKHKDNGDWDCGPCFKFIACPKDKINSKKPCITELTTEEIKKGIDEAIKKWPKSLIAKTPPKIC